MSGNVMETQVESNFRHFVVKLIANIDENTR